MSCKLNRSAYEKMIKENLEWLKKQPDTLENRHIQNIVKSSAEHEYGNPCEHNWVCADNESCVTCSSVVKVIQ